MTLHGHGHGQLRAPPPARDACGSALRPAEGARQPAAGPAALRSSGRWSCTRKSPSCCWAAGLGCSGLAGWAVLVLGKTVETVGAPSLPNNSSPGSARPCWGIHFLPFCHGTCGCTCRRRRTPSPEPPSPTALFSKPACCCLLSRRGLGHVACQLRRAGRRALSDDPATCTTTATTTATAIAMTDYMAAASSEATASYLSPPPSLIACRPAPAPAHATTTTLNYQPPSPQPYLHIWGAHPHRHAPPFPRNH